LIFIIVYMLFDSVIFLKELNNKLSVFLSLDLELVSLSFDLHYAFPLGLQCCLHLLHGPLEFGLLFLALLEFPLDPVDEFLSGANLLEFLIPHDAVFLKCFDPCAVVIEDLSHLNAHIALF
jgi:hypothetical protein